MKADKFLTLGMAIALLITQIGIALTKAILREICSKFWNKSATMNAKASIGSNALSDDFLINDSLDLLSSSSNEPSKTIKIRPMVPSIGNSGFKSGICMWNKSTVCFTIQPHSTRSMTEGIFVRAELMSKI